MRALVAMTVMLPLLSSPLFPQQETSEAPERDTTLACSGSCRGLGIEKVKAGDVHCGLVARERKDRALDLACSLSVESRDDLQSHAKQRALSKCSRPEGDGDLCTGSLSRWQNVYTNVLSQRCWAECGWAFLIEPGGSPIVPSTDGKELSDE
jgi:hypothetical protein